jgi:hypothetical protein
MKRAVAIVCLTVVFAAASAGKPVQAAAAALSGKMLSLQYLVGTWSCSNKMAAMGNMPAFTHQSTVSYEIEPNNTISYGMSSPGFSSAGFLGYLTAKQLWWDSAADNHGGVFLGSGTSGADMVLIGSGTTTEDSQPTPQRDTIIKSSPTKYEERAEIKTAGKWVLGVDSVCTKTSDNPG